MRTAFFVAVALMSLACSLHAAGVKSSIKIRAHVVSINQEKPTPDTTYVLLFGHPATAVKLKGEARCASAPQTLEGDAYPLTITFNVNPQPAPATAYPRVRLAIETAVDATGGEDSADEVELFGPAVGVIVWKDATPAPDTIHVDTLAGHDRRVYGPAMRDAAIDPADRPKKFIFGERYIGSDQNLVAWREGLTRLANLGFNATHVLPPAVIADARQLGFTRVWGAVYNPPGYAFNFEPNRHAQFVKFVHEQTDQVIAAGWKKEDIGFWFTSDEPGWYYPAQYDTFNKEPLALAAFHEYLKALHFEPGDFGKPSWDEVKLIGRKQYADLPSRKLFYWSNRFVPWASSRFFSEVTRAYEEVVRPGLPVICNFNNFIGRFYQPGAVGNNEAKTNPNAGMGQHDWLEFGRARGVTSLSTEDWFEDGAASQWSFYAARLRSAAWLGGEGARFGALVIPRVSGQTPMGMSQKLLALVGNGAKTINFFTFGPEYAFPGNCWSENTAVYKPLSTAMRIIAKAEDLMYPGEPRPSPVAILSPQSAQLWDLEEQPGVAKGLMDVTNTSMFAQHMQYESETYAIYRALQHSAIPAQFVDEQALAEPSAGLKDVRVLFVTAPDLPEESIKGLLAWVEAGGTLVTTAGAGTGDRYHQPTDALRGAIGVKPASALRPMVNGDGPSSGNLKRDDHTLPVFGERERVMASSEVKIVATFDDGSPAAMKRSLGKGRIVHFAAFPGYSYARSADDGWRQILISSVRDTAGIALPVTVSAAMIEAPSLYSDAGVAVTLLNWSGKSIETDIRVAVDKPVKRVESVLRGEVKFQSDHDGSVTVHVPVDAVDVLTFRY